MSVYVLTAFALVIIALLIPFFLWQYKRRTRKEYMSMNEQDKQREEALRLERQQAEQRAADGRQTEERQQAEQRQRQERAAQEERQRQEERRREEQNRQDETRRQEEERRRQEQRAQEERRKQESQQKEDSQRQEREPAREEQRKQESQRKEENTPQSQELRDLANTHDKYMRLAKSGYYDEKRAEAKEAKEQGKDKPATPSKEQGGFAARRETLKPKIHEVLKKQEQSKTPDIGRNK